MDIKTFLNQALPADRKNHLLAIGEYHNAHEHLRWLRAHLDKLKNEHQVKAIGMEFSPLMNVLFWAYKDGNLPVQKGKERAYLSMMLQSYSRGKFREHAAEQADLIMDALDKGIDVMGFDGRNTLASFLSSQNFSMDFLKKYPEVMQTMRSNPGADTPARSLEKVMNELHAQYPDSKGIEPQRIVADFGVSSLLLEVQSICAEHPEYAQRLTRIELRNQALCKSMKAMDMVSASLLKGMAQDIDGNIVIIYGNQHISGRTTPLYHTNGKLAEYISKQGWAITPVSMIGKDEFEDVMRGCAASYKQARVPAVSTQPANLLVLGAQDDDHLLIPDLHQGISPDDSKGCIGQYVAANLELFAATPEHVAADRGSVLQGAKRYLLKKVVPIFHSGDAPRQEASELLVNIQKVADDPEATYEEVLPVMRTALRQVQSVPDMDAGQKKSCVDILQQYVGYLEDYLGIELVSWESATSHASANPIMR